MVINYCLDCLHFDAVIGYKSAVARHSHDTVIDIDGSTVAVSMVAVHFAVFPVSHYSLLIHAIKYKAQIQKLFSFLLRNFCKIRVKMKNLQKLTQILGEETKIHSRFENELKKNT